MWVQKNHMTCMGPSLVACCINKASMRCTVMIETRAAAPKTCEYSMNVDFIVRRCKCTDITEESTIIPTAVFHYTDSERLWVLPATAYCLAEMMKLSIGPGKVQGSVCCRSSTNFVIHNSTVLQAEYSATCPLSGKNVKIIP